MLAAALLFAAAIIPNTALAADASIFKWEVIDSARTDENDNYITDNSITGFKDGVDASKYKDLVIPSMVDGVKITAVASSAFQNGEFDSITISDGIEYIGVDAFYGTTAKRINLGNTVTHIDRYAFYSNNELVDVTLSPHLKLLESRAFAYCSSLKNITLPDGLAYLGEEAFNMCTALESISVPDSVTEMGDCAFMNCTDMKTAALGTGLTFVPTATFANCNRLTNVYIPSSYTTIGARAFKFCNDLVNVDLPDSVLHIWEDAFLDSGIIDKQIKEMEQNGITQGGIYIGKILCWYYTDSLKNVNSYELESVSIKEDTVAIASGVFKGFSALKNVSLPESLKVIEYDAFNECTSLTNITLPKGLKTLASRAFYMCSGLSNITLQSGNALRNLGANSLAGTKWFSNQPDGVVYFGNIAYTYKGEMPEQNYTLTIKNGTKSIAEWGFSELYPYALSLPDSLEFIGDCAFYNFKPENQISIIIPDGVSYVGNQAFCNSYIQNFKVRSGGYSEGAVREYLKTNSGTIEIIGSSTMVTTTTTTTAKTTTTTTAKPAGMPGDVNLDNVVNLADVRAAVAAVASGSVGNLSEQAFKNGDVTYDGEFNLADIRKIVGAIASGNFTTLDK